MHHLSGLCHEKCGQRQIQSILDKRKIYFGAIKSQFGFQKVQFLREFFWSMSWEMWPEADLKHFRRQKKLFWGSRKSIWGPKRPISESYELNLVI